ncbi:MAG TPA: condensation domain-containing protein, partial [Thermoanaerobaculia bacterium]
MEIAGMQSVTEFLKTLASSGVKLSVEAGQLNCYAPSGALTNDLKKGILRYKPEILAWLEHRDRKRQDNIVRPSPARPREFPLASGQKGLYILQKINPGMTAYNLPLCVRVTGAIDADVLETAWRLTLDQYPILATRIVEDNGVLRHVVDERCRTSIERQSLEITDEQQLISFLRQRVKRPFDLDRGPLTRIELFTLNDRERILLLTIHHMIFDGVSAVLLLRSLFGNCQALSEGKPVPVPAERAGYEEFVAWEEAMLASPEGRLHADYWQQRLAGELSSLELFPDVPRLAAPSFQGASHVQTLPAELSSAIRTFAKDQSFLPSIVFLAAFKLLLHRYTSQDDIIVGMPVIVRPGQKFASEVGYFINMVPLRTRCSDQSKFSELLRDVRKTMLDAIYHSSYPFELMLDKLRTRSATKNAVFQVNFAYQNFVGDESFASIPRQPGIEITNVAEIGPEGYSDLGLEIFDKDAAFSIHLRYNPDVYPADAMDRFCRHYAALLQSITGDGDRRLHEYSIVPESEKQKLLVEFNATEAEFPKDRVIHDFFAEQVAHEPGKTAVVSGEK